MSLYGVLCFLPIFASSVFGACGKGATTINFGRQVCERKIIFEDDFTSNAVFLKNWRHATRLPGYPDHEFNMYYGRTNDTFSLNQGILHLRPSLLREIKDNDEFLYNGEIDLNEYPPKSVKCTKNHDSGFCKKKATGYQILPPIMTTRIYSKLNFRYGTVEIRAKVPKGDWIYPEIELTPRLGDSRYGKSSGRIIIAMVRGNEDLRYPGTDERINFGVTWLEAGIYAGTYNPRTSTHIVAAIESNQTAWSSDFHTYRVDWEPGQLTFYADGDLIGNGPIKTAGLLPKPMSDDAPADEEMVIALGIGVGGIQRFPDGVLSGGVPKPWKNQSPKALLNFWSAKQLWYPTWTQESVLKVDYVKAWSREVPTKTVTP